jgi:Fe-S-cluster-containing hydrogenase component 2/cytochrome c553
MSAMAADLARNDMIALGDFVAAQKPLPIKCKAAGARVAAGKKISDAVLCPMCRLGRVVGQSGIPRVAGRYPEHIRKRLADFKAKRRTDDAGNMTSVAGTLSDDGIESPAHCIANLNRRRGTGVLPACCVRFSVRGAGRNCRFRMTARPGEARSQKSMPTIGGPMQKSLHIEPAKCTGCLQCEMACSYENYGVFNPAKSRIKVFDFHHTGRKVPYTCTQCDEAWCLHACPVEAIKVDAATGAKVVLEDVCVGCKVCTIACPFGTINYVQDTGKVQKCDLCGDAPACVDACPTAAITYVDADWTGLERMRQWATKLDTQPQA